MNIGGRKVLVLGGYGLVGMAVCRELLAKRPREVQIHSLRQEEAEAARCELAAEAGGTAISISCGDIFGPVGSTSKRAYIQAQLGPLTDETLPGYLLYQTLRAAAPDIVVDCVNTATGIAYRDQFKAAGRVAQQLDAGLEGGLEGAAVEDLLEALATPGLIRHIQVLYRGMIDAGSRVYLKVGTTGTGGMGLNIPYTHSEERPSRVLLAKSALAGAHSMLLFLMARTPGAPITKEIKPAAAIGWKKIAHGPIHRRGQPLKKVEARPRPLDAAFSTCDPGAARELDEVLEATYIDTGENGLFSLEEFAALTTIDQMEFVTPEEIAQYVVYEIEGGNTGRDVIAALDGAVLGPTYRAGALRHRALERMTELERQHGGTRSVAFEMLGPPRVSKLLFEAHLLRETFDTLAAVAACPPAELCTRLNAKVAAQPELANEIAAVGVPLLLASGQVIRGPKVLVPADAVAEPVTPAKLETWVQDGWVDLREANCRRWAERARAIRAETEALPQGDSSSRHLRQASFWHGQGQIEPGKLVGWVLSVEERGARIKH